MSGYPGEGGPTVEPGEWLGARDLSRLDAMVSWLEANPLVHDQKTWGYLDPTAPTVTIPGNGEICGTACCLAGWTLLFDHEHYHFDAEVNRIVDKRNETRWLDSDDFIRCAGGRLGLTDLEASVLFSACNTLGDLRKMTTDLQAGVDITDSDYDLAGSVVKVHVGDDDPTPDDCDAGWCGAQHPEGYRCTWLAGHLTDDHVAGSSSGRVVAVWPVTA